MHYPAVQAEEGVYKPVKKKKKKNLMGTHGRRFSGCRDIDG